MVLRWGHRSVGDCCRASNQTPRGGSLASCLTVCLTGHFACTPDRSSSVQMLERVAGTCRCSGDVRETLVSRGGQMRRCICGWKRPGHMRRWVAGGGVFTAAGVRCTHTVPARFRSSSAGSARGLVRPTPKSLSAALCFVFLSQQECIADIRPSTLYLLCEACLALCLHFAGGKRSSGGGSHCRSKAEEWRGGVAPPQVRHPNHTRT